MATESFGACKHKDIQLVHIFDCLADASLHTRLSTRSHNLILMGGLWDSYTCPKISGQSTGSMAYMSGGKCFASSARRLSNCLATEDRRLISISLLQITRLVRCCEAPSILHISFWASPTLACAE